MKLSINIASEADYDGIMEISKDIYAGCDPLPHILRSWLKEGLNEPLKRQNLVLRNEETRAVIGYQSYLIQDGGKYAVQQALRVDERIRGLNIGKKFMLMGEEHLRDNNIQIQVKVSWRGNTRESAFFSPSMGRLSNERSGFRVILPWNSLFQAVPATMDLSLQRLELVELCKMLQTKSKFNDRFICNGFLLLDWIPYHVNSLTDIPTTHYNDIFSLVDDKNPQESLSVMTRPYPVPIGSRLALDIYTEDIDVAKKHVNEQLRHLLLAMPEKKHDEANIVVQFFVNREVAEDLKEYVMEGLKLGQLMQQSREEKVPLVRIFEKEVA